MIEPKEDKRWEPTPSKVEPLAKGLAALIDEADLIAENLGVDDDPRETDRETDRDR